MSNIIEEKLDEQIVIMKQILDTLNYQIKLMEETYFSLDENKAMAKKASTGSIDAVNNMLSSLLNGMPEKASVEVRKTLNDMLNNNERKFNVTEGNK